MNFSLFSFHTELFLSSNKEFYGNTNLQFLELRYFSLFNLHKFFSIYSLRDGDQANDEVEDDEGHVLTKEGPGAVGKKVARS